MSPDDLVHIADWPRFVRYVREDRIHAETWRPPYVNIDVSPTLAAAQDVTDAQLGSWLRLVLEYASSPLLDPAAGPQGPRRMHAAHGQRSFRVRPAHFQRTWEALSRAGLIEFSPGVLPDRQQQTREDLRPRPSRARAAPVEDQDQEIREGTAAAGSPASESEIREAVASLRGADRQSLNIVEPLANAVTRETFLDLVDRARDVRNPVGWLVERLRAINREVRLDAQTVTAPPQERAPIERLSPEEALEANVRQLADNGHPWEAIAEHVSAVFGEKHLDTAEAIYTRASEAA